MSGVKTPEEILSRYENAIRNRDPQAIIADYVDDPVAYDLAPPLQHRGAQILDPAGLQEWFDTWEDDLRVTYQPPTVLEEGDLAVVWTLQNMTGTKKGESKSSLWFRATFALRRVAGDWKIVHIHTSVPMAMDGSGKALTDLTPGD